MAYEPNWADEVLGYAMRYLARQAWRVSPLMEIDDMLQESFVLFVKLIDRYEFESPSHFMAMWKRCLRNEVWMWANNRSKARQEHMSDRLYRQLPAKRDNSMAWERHESTATGCVRKLIDATRSRIRRPRRRHADGRRLTTNEYLCRYAGVPSTVPLRRLFDLWLDDM